MKSERLIFVDCEAPFGKGAPSVADMTCFGAVDFETRATFYGPDCSAETFMMFDDWLRVHLPPADRLTFVSDNPAYDWQWINFYFWKHLGRNPFGHTARRIGDFYAGLKRNWHTSNDWKSLRRTKHDHNPVNDAMGNAEAFGTILNHLNAFLSKADEFVARLEKRESKK
jgi:hypothetical protein